MTFGKLMIAARKLACAALLAAGAAQAHAGALSEGFVLAGELYAASLVGASAPASRRPPAGTPVPAALSPRGGQRVDRIAARGVQVYECRLDAGGAAWALVAPEATLVDAQGEPAGRHYAGPHWEAPDGSRIVGAVIARADAPLAGAIPWLLLATRSVGGAGRYASVTSVQRINTVGGVAPARGCDATTVGAVARVPYTADYVLLAPSAR